MIATFFVDTNVLLYAASNAPEDQIKRDVARQVLSQPGIGFSAQVLQEFYSAGRPEVENLKPTRSVAKSSFTGNYDARKSSIRPVSLW